MITQSDLLCDLKTYTLSHLGCSKTQFQDWLDALRSGKYQQIRGCLHNTEGFCCLGVRAEIELVQSGIFEWHEHETDKKMYSLKHGIGFNDEALLPTDLMPECLQELLSECNDGGLTFAEIADALEAHFMPLFEAEK